MSRPDIAMIAPYPPRGERHGGSSGVASYTANLATALADEGARVVVIAPEAAEEPRRSRDGDVAVLRAFSTGPLAVPAAARAAAATGAPVVHVQHETFLYGGPASVPGSVAALAGLRAAGRRAVVTMHQVVAPDVIDEDFTSMHRVDVPPAVARAAFGGLQWTVSRLASSVIVHEPSFAGVVDGARVIPHGIEPVEPLPRDEARAALGLERFTALCFGFIAPYKGLEHALGAAAGAASWDLVVAGGTHPRLGPDYERGLQQRHGDAADFTGFVPDEDVARWFSAADVALFLYPQPHASSGPLALALAYGTPFIVSPELARTIDAPPETVVDLDADAVRARVDELATDAAAREELGAACARMASGRTWPEVARRHLALYEAVRS